MSFTLREEKVIKIVGRKSVTLKEIADVLFKTEQEPFDPTISVNNTIIRINKKCAKDKLDWKFIKYRANKKMLIKKEKV